MAGEEPNGSGRSRLDRMEGLMELLIDDHVRFQDDLKQLLTAQVVLTDRVDKLTVSVATLAEAQKHTDERLNALISIVDGLIRKQPPP